MAEEKASTAFLKTGTRTFHENVVSPWAAQWENLWGRMEASYAEYGEWTWGGPRSSRRFSRLLTGAAEVGGGVAKNN